jgi:3-deoxy-D-manno-octulosonic-acid transferase
VLILFTIGVLLYTLGVCIAAFFGNVKAKHWIQGRLRQMKEFRIRSRAKLPLSSSDGDWIWFHAASLGEFEQGRPVIEAIKNEYPQYKILLSFFSPSGYEVRKDYPLADEVLYLPSDTALHAKQWLQRHHFVAAFFIKYEFWFNYMKALKKADIPLFYVSLIFNEKSFFFKPLGKWFRKQLHNVTYFFVQDKMTADLLHEYGFDNCTICGDTRFDRVAAIAKQAKPFPEVERFIGGRKCIIAGSTWPFDEKLLAAFYPKLPDDYCLIVAPHDISASHIAQIKGAFPEAVLYSEWSTHYPCHTEAQPRVSIGSEVGMSNILIINTIGILSQLYQYARFAYIGGGFGVNIHNIQEPVTFGCPVVFGPKYTSFKEAVDLVNFQGAFSVKDAAELEQIFTRLMNDEAFFAKASETCTTYMKCQVGATEKIMQGFKNIFFL